VDTSRMLPGTSRKNEGVFFSSESSNAMLTWGMYSPLPLWPKVADITFSLRLNTCVRSMTIWSPCMKFFMNSTMRSRLVPMSRRSLLRLSGETWASDRASERCDWL